MKTTEFIPCSCGKGAIEIEVLTLGAWRVDKLLNACVVCRSTDIRAAREAQAARTSKFAE